MPTCYKVTRKDLTCYGGYQYEVGVPRTVEHYTGEMCSSGVLHAYRTAEDAVFFDPIHAEYLPDGLLWEAEYSGRSVDDGSKLGVETLTLLRQISPPVLTSECRVRKAIEAAMTVYHDPVWLRWAERWLSGDDRSPESAESAAKSARAAAKSAKSAAQSAKSAAQSAQSAAQSAQSAEWLAVAWSAGAAWSAEAWSEAAARSARSAELAARSARSAADGGKSSCGA